MKAAIYTRVSTRDQTAEQQEAACRKYCELRDWEVGALIEETSSTGDTRPEKEALLLALRRGEFGGLVVFRLDRWARTVREFVLELEDLLERGVVIASVTETVDTSTAMGKAMFQLAGLFAELERGLIRERTAARLQALKRMGKKLGRPAKIIPAIEARVTALRADGMSLRAIARAVGLGETTVRRMMRGNVGGLTEAGLTPSEIARATGLQEAAVLRVLAKPAPQTPSPQGPSPDAQEATAPKASALAGAVLASPPAPKPA